jgi:hypothetical protein
MPLPLLNGQIPQSAIVGLLAVAAAFVVDFDTVGTLTES